MAGTSVGEVPRKLRIVWACFEREVNAACIRKSSVFVGGDAVPMPLKDRVRLRIPMIYL